MQRHRIGNMEVVNNNNYTFLWKFPGDIERGKVCRPHLSFTKLSIFRNAQGVQNPQVLPVGDPMMVPFGAVKPAR